MSAMIVSNESRESVEELAKHPVIADMASALGEITWDEMRSTSFMSAANAEARSRGVDDALITMIGSVRMALIALVTRNVPEKFIENSTGPRDMQIKYFTYQVHALDTLIESIDASTEDNDMLRGDLMVQRGAYQQFLSKALGK